MKTRNDGPRVLYVGPVGVPGGYGGDARETVQALKRAGVNVAVMAINRPGASLSGHYGPGMDEVRALVDVDLGGRPDIVILHTEPVFAADLLEEARTRYECPEARVVLKTVWETDRLPVPWFGAIRELDPHEVWVPSVFNRTAFIPAAPAPRVVVIPHAHDIETFERTVSPLDLGDDVEPGTFVFSSVFQWTERKNPEGLLVAYLSEFAHDEKVLLVLKTFGEDGSPGPLGGNLQRDALEMKVHEIRNRLGRKRFAPILLLTQLLPQQRMIELYRRTDCGVYLHRGEGWGKAISETMLAGKPVIVSSWSGSLDFTDAANSFYVQGMLTPVRGMKSPWYTPEQRWLEPNLDEATRHLRYAFNHRAEVIERGRRARKSIARFSLDAVGKMMAERLVALASVSEGAP